MVRTRTPAAAYKIPISAASQVAALSAEVLMPKKSCVKPVITSARPKKIINNPTMVIPTGRDRKNFMCGRATLLWWVEPTGPARSGRPDDGLRETHRGSLEN